MSVYKTESNVYFWGIVLMAAMLNIMNKCEHGQLCVRGCHNVKVCIVGTRLTVLQLCVLVWQQSSNIFAPPDGGLTCLVCESNTAASLAELTSNPLTAIADDTWWYNHNRSSGKQKADITNIFQNWFCVSTNACPAPCSRAYSREDLVKGSFWHGICASGLVWLKPLTAVKIV